MQEKTYDFCETLGELDAGVFNQKLSKAVQEAAHAVLYNGDRGRKGKVKIELTIARIGESAQVEVQHKLAYEKPTLRGKSTEEDVTSTALYVGRQGALSVVPDAQVDLFKSKETT